MNLVLDNVKEAMTGKHPPFPHIPIMILTLYYTDADNNVRYRNLGLIVARGTLLVVISPVDGSEEIENPFLQQEEE